LTQSHVDYWIKKKYDPDFHSSGWGKHKNRKRVFSEDEMPQVFCSFQTYIKENPYAKVADITEMFVNTFQRKCSQTTTKRLLKIWKWSWKVPAYVQTHKSE